MRAATQPLTTLLLALMLAVGVSGCATSLPAPETPRQTLAYTEASFTAVVQTLDSQRDQAVLTPDQIAAADTLIEQGNTALIDAHAALDTPGSGTLQGRLAVVSQVLAQLRAVLQETVDE